MYCDLIIVYGPQGYIPPHSAAAVYQPGSHTPRLLVCCHISIVSRVWVERHTAHCLLYNIAHLQESATIFKKAAVHNLVGGIDNARHIAAFPYRFERQAKTAELLRVGLEELQRMAEKV